MQDAGVPIRSHPIGRKTPNPVAPAPVLAAAPTVAPVLASTATAAPIAASSISSSSAHTVDAFINFGNAPYSEAQSLTTGTP